MKNAVTGLDLRRSFNNSLFSEDFFGRLLDLAILVEFEGHFDRHARDLLPTRCDSYGVCFSGRVSPDIHLTQRERNSGSRRTDAVYRSHLTVGVRDFHTFHLCREFLARKVLLCRQIDKNLVLAATNALCQDSQKFVSELAASRRFWHPRSSKPLVR